MGHQEGTPRSVLKRVAGWTLGSTLGRGGFGHVRKATHPGGRLAAVKILPALKPDEPISKDQFLDATEAYKEVVMMKIFTGLGLPGFVGLDLVKEDKEWKYLFMQMKPGSASSLARNMTQEQAVPLMRGLLCHLHSMHMLGFYHEDIKPGNILLDNNKTQPIIADFGFSTFSSYGQKVRGGGGTAEYMSPEKLEDMFYRGAPSDIHACGILFSKWLSDSNPFVREKGEPDEVMEQRIIDGDALWKLPDEPGSAGELLRKMCARNPKERWSIPEILDHPYLNPTNSKVPLQVPVIPKLSEEPIREPAYHIVQDIIFLANLAGEWYPCMSDKSILRHLRDDKHERWEKRLYHALASWSPKDPDNVGTPSPVKATKAKSKSLARILSEARLDNNVPKSSSTSGYDQPLRSVAMSASKPAATSLTVVDKENVVQQQATPEIIVIDEDDDVDAAQVGGLVDKFKKVAVTKGKKAVKPAAKPTTTTKKTAKQVPEVIEVESSDEEDGQEEFLPAPKPKTALRRSPRLAGKAPEHAGLLHEGRRLRSQVV